VEPGWPTTFFWRGLDTVHGEESSQWPKKRKQREALVDTEEEEEEYGEEEEESDQSSPVGSDSSIQEGREERRVIRSRTIAVTIVGEMPPREDAEDAGAMDIKVVVPPFQPASFTLTTQVHSIETQSTTTLPGVSSPSVAAIPSAPLAPTVPTGFTSPLPAETTSSPPA